MDIVLLILVFIFGTIIGSFLNVVAIRFNTGKTIGGRSRCMSCNNQLSWKELIPVISFLIQGGACRKCGSKISWQYPLVELLTGAIFLLVFIYYPPLSAPLIFQTLFYLFVSSLLIAISVYDIKHKIIPNIFVYIFIFASFVGIFIGGETWFHLPSLNALIAGPLLALPFALIGFISKQTWMGLGDAKLIIGIGWLLGLGAGANAIILSFWIAAAIALIWLYAKYGTFKAKTEIPFGPFLIIGMFIVLFFHIQVIDFSLVENLLW